MHLQTAVVAGMLELPKLPKLARVATMVVTVVPVVARQVFKWQLNSNPAPNQEAEHRRCQAMEDIAKADLEI